MVGIVVGRGSTAVRTQEDIVSRMPAQRATDSSTWGEGAGRPSTPEPMVPAEATR